MRLTALATICLLLISCKTVGVARERGGYHVVRPTIAHEMMLDNPTIVILDFRPADEYRGPVGHIAGAISLPLEGIEERLPELVAYSNSTILVYAGTVEDTERGARLLNAAGFRAVVVIQGGIDRWIELGYKAVTSS